MLPSEANARDVRPVETPDPAAPDAGGAAAEVDRVLQICNACRYCEGFCAVFPAMTRRIEFSLPDIHYLSNRRVDPPQRLQAGIYGLSNAFLDTPWPKVTRAVGRFACQIAQRVDAPSLMRLLADREIARDHDLPQTGVPLEWERVLSSIQIRANGSPRAANVCAASAGHWRRRVSTPPPHSSDPAPPPASSATRTPPNWAVPRPGNSSPPPSRPPASSPSTTCARSASAGAPGTPD